MTHFALEPLYGSLLVTIVCAIVVVAVIAWVTPPTPKPEQRRWLIGLRGLAALVLLLAAFRPSLIRTDNRPADATLVVAADVSKSMTLADGDGGDRWTTQQQAWQALASGLAAMDESLNVQWLTYDGSAEPLLQSSTPEQTIAAGEALQAIQPDGDATDLGAALEAAIAAAAGQPMAGVILMGDGTQTAKRDGAAAAQAASRGAQSSAEILNSLGVPFWTVPIGPPAGDTGSRDVAVDAMPEVFQLFSGNQFDVTFQLSLRGLANTEVPLKVTWIASDGSETVAAERTRATQRANDVLGVTIPLTAPKPGAYRLKVAAENQSGEWVTSNNSQTAFAEVREGGGRVFYAEGAQRPEQTFLSRALRGFPDLQLQYQWIHTNQKWPVDLGNVFAPNQYDIYILGDLDATALGTDQLQKLRDRVADGGALVTLGGFQTYGTGGYATSPLADVLPVRMDASRRRANFSIGSIPTDSPGQLTDPVEIVFAKQHPITDLGGDDPATVWSQLSPLSGANRLLGPRVAAGVQVLLQTPEGQPLLTVGEFGSGRVTSLAFDETHRWWRQGNSEAHRRFWRQLMLWLMSREESGADKVIVKMDSRRFETKATPEFTASVTALTEDQPRETLIAEILAESSTETNSVSTDAQTVPTTSIVSATSVAAVSGKIPELEPGFYRLRVKPADPASKIQPGELAFQVIEASRELSRPMADPLYMKQLADLTADHGGGAYRADQMEQLLEQIAARRKKAEAPVVDRYRLGDGPLSGWIVFTLFAAALSTEWYLRRRWGMA
ncbi:glutamine amidotransferase [Stieleria varia]|uniref:Glutamine amidotransferase domain-containing protein n=1 Tax=Stieleria varia TaxID=2528005 RepID=A0A5C6A4B3_9BACT|nr:glutamine amidotransferase [Stieleria varia]TWT93223.1 hypothetical protein Pla52n_58800 [Stieleria varia]